MKSIFAQQPEAIQYFNSPTLGIINYTVLRLSDGATIYNVSNTDNQQYNLWGYLSTDYSGNIVTIGNLPPNKVNVVVYNPQANEYSLQYGNANIQFGYSLGLQSFVWNQKYSVVSTAGIDFGTDVYSTLAILNFGFGKTSQSTPVDLGISENATARFNGNPLGAYDGSNYYYIFYNLGSQLGLVRYSFADSSIQAVEIDAVGGPNSATQSLYYYNGQVILATLTPKWGVTIATIAPESGDFAIIYKDGNYQKKSFSGLVQPFVFDSNTGTITILNVNGLNLFVDIFSLSTLQVKSSVFTNTIPIGTLRTISVSAGQF
ncbi:hypothetical protein DFA_02068 [Cavenderia fasciculata]|uniref:Uncharacterized protein n=1 Tax=Cavenderia fasciculata TaxID=261658 RepID=F4PYL5_CACFS|nr:uncharacterized protein DFA_02068 [Cavenderia fasciculata]EGG19281.1 hypothetical protein DFA_02068 [Cavenderia fasciculata]|eukprot:XP_004357552.1 hypothetical protein DFA_02068 [Cavenderia fasciculata]